MPTFPMNLRRVAASLASVRLALIVLILGVTATAARAEDGQWYLGEVRLLPHATAPKNWMACNGQTLSIAQNSALFSLLSTTFGGDGVRTFALPNLGPVKLAEGELRYYILVSGIYPSAN